VKFGQAQKLPMDTIDSLPIRVTVKPRRAYLEDTAVEAQEYASVQALKEALKGPLLQALSR